MRSQDEIGVFFLLTRSRATHVVFKSNPTLSVSELKTGIPEGSRDVPPIPGTHCPAVGFLPFRGPMASRQQPGKQKIVMV